MRWESLFADERGEEGLSRLMPDVPRGAIAFTQARPSDELFPVEEFRRCCNTVLRNDCRRVLQFGLFGWLRAAKARFAGYASR